MKFAISAVVMLALAFGVESSILPWAGHGLIGHPAAISLSQGPLLTGAWGHPAAISLSQGPVLSAGWGHPAAISVAHGHIAAPIVAAHAAPLVHAHEGRYVSQTRGAVHSAPLAGHINSVSSINVEPAPGTL